MKLRPYQIDDLNKIVDALNDKTDGKRSRVLFQAATGYGKTELFATLIEQVSDAGDRVLVLSHLIEIVDQISARLRRRGVQHGVIAPTYRASSDLVQVASVATVKNRLDRLPPPTFIVVDEAHHAKAKTWLKILGAFPNADILGVTATPRRLDGKPLGDIFDVLITGTPMNDLIDLGYLAPPVVFTPPIDPDLSNVRVTMGEYAVKELAEAMSAELIIEGAADEYRERCDGAPAIAFCVSIEHSKLVAAEFRRQGYQAEHVDGDTPKDQRRAAMNGLRNGSLDVLCNCSLISEGFDAPAVEAVILLRPTQSLGLYLQMVGRAMRPGKEIAFVLDHAGNTARHGLPTAPRKWSLKGQQPKVDVEVFRCKACGAVNDREATHCVNCGEPLHGKRGPREYTIGSAAPLAEAVETPKSDDDLRLMSHRAVLRWAAPDGILLDKRRLERAAAARDFRPGWVHITYKLRTLQQALDKYWHFRKQKENGPVR